MRFSPRAISNSTASALAVAADPSPCPVTFSPDPVKAGFTNPPASSTLKVTLTATVTPKEDVANIILQRGGAVPDRINLNNQVKHPDLGTITVDVLGRTATPATNTAPDTTVDAIKDGAVICSVPVWVLIPKAIGRPHPEKSGVVAFVNQAASGATSPAYGGPLGPGQVVLWTYWAQWLAIPVVDQFYNLLDSLYDGQDAFEYDGGWKPINQKLSDGKYKDPAFAFQYKNNNGVYIVAANSQEAQSWPTNPPANFPTGTSQVQNIRVRVAGFELQAVGADGKTLSSPAIQNRQLSAPRLNEVDVVWP